MICKNYSKNTKLFVYKKLFVVNTSNKKRWLNLGIVLKSATFNSIEGKIIDIENFFNN